MYAVNLTGLDFYKKKNLTLYRRVHSYTITHTINILLCRRLGVKIEIRFEKKVVFVQIFISQKMKNKNKLISCPFRVSVENNWRPPSLSELTPY